MIKAQIGDDNIRYRMAVFIQPCGCLPGMRGATRDMAKHDPYGPMIERSPSMIADATNRNQSGFQANRSQVIRAPIRRIGMSQLAMCRDMDEQPHTDAQNSDTMAEYPAGVLNDHLKRSRNETGVLLIGNGVFDPRQLVERVIHLMEHAAQDKDIELVIDYSTNLGRYYQGAPLEITQVLIGLLSNAIKFTDTGTVRLGVSRPITGILRFEVEDTGVGITPEEQQRLFQTDAQARSRSTCRFGSTGLGLVIARQLVELMGGYIEVDSEPGWGSCFAFEIAAVASSYMLPSLW